MANWFPYSGGRGSYYFKYIIVLQKVKITVALQ